MAEKQILPQDLVNSLLDLTKVMVKQVVEKKETTLVAQVVVALPLDTEDRLRLQKALETYTNSAVEIRESVDPSIIGGIIVKLRDRVFNNSIAFSLETIRANIAAELENV